MTWPNDPAPGNARLGAQLAFEYQCPGVPEPGRSPMMIIQFFARSGRRISAREKLSASVAPGKKSWQLFGQSL